METYIIKKKLRDLEDGAIIKKVSIDHILSYLHVNNQYVMLTESEILHFITLSMNLSNNQEEIDVERIEEWILQQAKKVSIKYHQNDLI